MENRETKITNFLKFIAAVSHENSEIEITPQLVYANLIDTSKKVSHIEFIDEWVEYFENTDNLKTEKIEGEHPFIEYTNNEEEVRKKDTIRLYLSFDKKHIDAAVTSIFSYLASNDISHISRVAMEERKDGIVIALTSIEDAKKVSKFIKNNKRLENGFIPGVPFLLTENNIAYATSHKLSYNMTLSKIISSYINEIKKRTTLAQYYTQINSRDFKLYIDTLYISLTTSKEISIEEKINMVEVYKLISNSLSEHFTIDEYYNHFNNVKNKEKTSGQRLTYLNSLVSEIVVNGNNISQKPELLKNVKEPIIQEEVISPFVDNLVKDNKYDDFMTSVSKVILVMSNKYGVSLTRKAFYVYYNNGGIRSFTREKEVRKYMESLSRVDFKNSFDKYYNEGELPENMLKFVIDVIDNAGNVFTKAVDTTTKKYSKKQSEAAIDSLITNNVLERFSNTDLMRNKLEELGIDNDTVKLIGANINGVNMLEYQIESKDKYIELFSSSRNK